MITKGGLMSYKEFIEATTPTDQDNSIVIGKSGVDKDSTNSTGATGGTNGTEIRIHYYVGSMSDNSDRAFIEGIMSRSLLSMNELNKPGDVSVFREDSTFTKDGDYIVAIKYGEVHTSA
jgi:hypothetical protein